VIFSAVPEHLVRYSIFFFLMAHSP